MRSLRYLSLIGAAHAAVVRRDITYSQTTRDSTYAKSFGATGQNSTVNQGVQIWLSGGGTHNWYGNVNNFGSVIISQTDYLKTNPNAGGQTCDWTGSNSANGNLINNVGASIYLNDYGSASAPTYDWNLHTMENYGTMQWCGRGDTGGSTYQLYCDIDCHNYGVIDFEQYNRNLGASFVWRNDVIGNTAQYNIYNEGAFRIANVVYHNVQNVYGRGCWVIDESSVLYLEDGSGSFQNPGYGPTFANQTIYFTDAVQTTARLQTLHMDTAVYSRNSNFGPQVYNFGSGKAIEFYETINTFSYANGILTVVMVSRNQVNIKLGTGYDASQFYKANNPQHYNTGGYNAIFYRNAAPSQTVPAVCSVSLARCADPGVTAVATSTTTTTTTTTVPPTTTTVAVTTTTTTINAVYVTVTSVYRGTGTIAEPSTSTVAQPSGTAPGTVAVYYNPNTSTITSLDNGNTVRTTTLAEQNGPTAGTVEVLVPGYTTITTVYRGTGTISPEPSTSTVVQPTGTTSGTVDVFYNPNTVTITSLDSGNTTRTSTLAEQNGPTPGTVQILAPGYTTITTVYRGTGTISPEPSTSTVVQPTGTTSGTVDVFYNPNTVTITSLDSGNTTRTSTLAEQTGPTPGTVRVLVPGYNTVTTVYRGTGTISPEPSTTTIAQPTGSTPGTVDVFYNPNTVTTTSFDNGDTTRTSTLAEQTGPTPGTVAIVEPSYVRRTSIYTGTGTISPEPSTSTVAQPNGATQGTLDIYYNPNTVTVTSFDNGDTTRTTTLAQQTGSTPGTVAIVEPSYVRRTSVYRGAGTISPEPSTSTVAQPNGATQGTLDVYYNPNTVTITSLDNGDSTRTTTLAQQTGSQAGTVAVLEPSYATITTTSGSVAATSTISQPTGTTQGTVLVIVATTTTAITTTTTPAVATTTTTTTLSTSSVIVGNGPCANGAQPDRTYTTSGGDVYGVCLNTNFVGGDLTTVNNVPDANSCTQVCSSTPNCVAGSLNKSTNVCTLKSTLNAGQSDPNFDSVYKISSASTTLSTTTAVPTTTTISSLTSISTTSSSAAPIGTGPCANGAGPDRTYTTSNGDVYGVCLNTEFSGNDLNNSSTPVAASTPEQCANICTNTPGCVAGTLVRGGPCYLKSARPQGTPNTNTDAIYKISSGTPITTTSTVMTSSSTSSAPATTSTATGPCANGAGPDSTLTLDNGDVYGVCLNTDFSGGDSGTQTGITSPRDLAQACSNTPNCVAGSVNRSSQVGSFKKARNPGTSNSGIDSVYKISAGNRPTTTSSNCVCPSLTTVTYRSVVTATATATRTN